MTFYCKTCGQKVLIKPNKKCEKLNNILELKCIVKYGKLFKIKGDHILFFFAQRQIDSVFSSASFDGKP